MPSREPRPGSSGLARRFLAALAMAIGLAGPVSAASIGTATAHAEDDHARYCRCRNCNPDSCCCGPRKTRAAVAVAPPPAGTVPGPCMKSAPCGGEQAAPGSSTVSPIDRTANLADLVRGVPPAAARLAPALSRPILPARLPGRLDDPPDASATV